jgi:hypothetical protein
MVRVLILLKFLGLFSKNNMLGSEKLQKILFNFFAEKTSLNQLNNIKFV